IRKTFGRLKLFLKRLQDAVQLVEQKRRKPSLCAECAQSFPLRFGDRCALFAAIPSNQELFVVVDEPSIFRMLVDCVKLQPFAFGGGESMLLRQRIELLALFAAYRPDAGVELDESSVILQSMAVDQFEQKESPARNADLSIEFHCEIASVRIVTEIGAFQEFPRKPQYGFLNRLEIALNVSGDEESVIRKCVSAGEHAFVALSSGGFVCEDYLIAFAVITRSVHHQSIERFGLDQILYGQAHSEHVLAES